MLKIDTERKELALLQIDEIGSLTQHFELRELIGNSPDAFFGEIGQDVFVIGKEIRLSDAAQIEVDLVALDRRGE